MADNEKIIDLFKDLMYSSDDPRSDVLKDSEHAHFLFNNDLDRWVPGTEDPIESLPSSVDAKKIAETAIKENPMITHSNKKCQYCDDAIAGGPILIGETQTEQQKS